MAYIALHDLVHVLRVCTLLSLWLQVAQYERGVTVYGGNYENTDILLAGTERGPGHTYNDNGWLHGGTLSR